MRVFSEWLRHGCRQLMSAAVSSAAVCLAMALAAPAQASVISPDPTFPTADGIFLYVSGGVACPTSFGLCLLPTPPANLTSVSSSFDSSGEKVSFQAQFSFEVATPSLQNLGSFTITGTLGETVFGRTNATETGAFNTGVTSLVMEGAFNGLTITVALAPDNPTVSGQTAILPLGNEFAISSFFDVFGDLTIQSIDGTTEPTPVQVELFAVPEPGTAVLLGLPLLAIAFRRSLAACVA
jgi:hypothetical protein